jgi:hypothetical protein
MASNQVATTFTAAYWIGTVPLGMSLVNYSAPWFWIGWIAAVLFFDIPLTAILWIMVLLARFSRFNISGTHFAAIGTAVPALYASYMMARPRPRRSTSSRAETQLRELGASRE